MKDIKFSKFYKEKTVYYTFGYKLLYLTIKDFSVYKCREYLSIEQLRNGQYKLYYNLKFQIHHLGSYKLQLQKENDYESISTRLNPETIEKIKKRTLQHLHNVIETYQNLYSLILDNGNFFQTKIIN